MRVVGHLRSFKQQKSVIVFSIRPIAHFNEITSHLMETLHGYLCLQKGPNVVSDHVIHMFVVIACVLK